MSSTETEYVYFESHYIVQAFVVMVILVIVAIIIFELWRIGRRQKKDGPDIS